MYREHVGKFDREIFRNTVCVVNGWWRNSVVADNPVRYQGHSAIG